jgi:putative addiction module component (TIGR02574 family)
MLLFGPFRHIILIMSRVELLKEAKRLSLPERLDLIDRLIESVEEESPEVLSPQAESELDRRYRAYLASPEDGEPWEVTRQRIQRSLDAAGDRGPS